MATSLGMATLLFGVGPGEARCSGEAVEDGEAVEAGEEGACSGLKKSRTNWSGLRMVDLASSVCVSLRIESTHFRLNPVFHLLHQLFWLTALAGNGFAN